MAKQAWQGSTRRTTLPRGWARLRALALRRDKNRCTEDGCTQPANHVDHVTPHHQGGTDTLDNLASLCADHHAIKSAREGAAAAGVKRSSMKRATEPHPGIR